VFDSGLGSLSIIRPIQKITKSEIIYFADQKNFPYGKKTKLQLSRTIKKTIKVLKNEFSPDLIVIGSNTPTIMLNDITFGNVIGVLPPLKKASKITKTQNIAILATHSAVNSRGLSNYIKKHRFSKKIVIKKINISPLVELVESGKFIGYTKTCQKKIKNTLENDFTENNIDVATLSSTHLSFLTPILEKLFPDITFLDPAQDVADKVAKLTSKKRSKKNSLKIFTSKNTTLFQKQLQKIGIKNKVNFLSL